MNILELILWQKNRLRPNSYKNEDEGKVVDSGALVEQTSRKVTANGIYDTTTNNQVTVEVHPLYGFHIDSSESDPSACITYLEDAVGATPAYMDFENDTFHYGSWENAFFMPKPCMLRYDGTVDYYLDPNDYSKKADGTASDIEDFSYNGNAMMEWGQNGKKIWYKIVPDTNDNTSANVYISDSQVDSNYHAWSFINNDGDLVDHFYTPIYNGSLDLSDKLRSISNKDYSLLCKNKTAEQEIAAAQLNNLDNDNIWYTEVYSDITLINLLLILIGKSLNVQAVFGNGRINQAFAQENMIKTGTMNQKGLFWGSSGINYGVKVFGMENWWGNQWRRYAGHVMIDYVQKYKMTYGTEDGSTQDGYISTDTANDYSNYLTGTTSPETNNYIKEMQFDENCFQTKTVGGDSSHYWCDHWYQNSGLRYALRGGSCGDGFVAGAFCVRLHVAPDGTGWRIGAALSCKL